MAGGSNFFCHLKNPCWEAKATSGSRRGTSASLRAAPPR
jgi:hypothetical protein